MSHWQAGPIIKALWWLSQNLTGIRNLYKKQYYAFALSCIYEKSSVLVNHNIDHWSFMGETPLISNASIFFVCFDLKEHGIYLTFQKVELNFGFLCGSFSKRSVWYIVKNYEMLGNIEMWIILGDNWHPMLLLLSSIIS